MKEADINKTAIISRLKAYRERNGARAYRIVAHYVGSKRISDDVLRAIVSNAYRNLLLITDAQMARLNKSGFVKVDKDLTVASLLVCDVISKTARRKEEMTRGKKHEKNC